ncbi:unnamed protein product, partial [Mesorhabditis belari]|uniref:FYVE-type domain-containing protein n=1 Tax=Mesorhabditis belari TaxID=2138241 RepID=A0AAF3J357_9BILA
MHALRKILNKPRPDDWAPLAKFYYADEALNDIASELDSFDGRRDPERCNNLVNKLRVAQDRVLHIIGEMLVTLFPREADRACRDFRVKFPDEIVHENLPGQLWFGAECLAAGSNIIDHEAESERIRPLAKELTRHLDSLRDMLKDQSLRDTAHYTEQIKENLLKFDRLFADFEFKYVSAMVPVKSVKEHDCQLDVAVLFSDCLERALRVCYVTQDQIDYCDPSVMIVVPRLAIVWGLILYPDGALNVEGPAENLSEMFRPFHSLLTKIRNLLRVLESHELRKLEQILCTGESNETRDESPDALMMSDFRAGSGEEIGDFRFGLREKRPSGDSHDLRARFRSAEDLLHRLFVCISGVADQLQSNYSSEVRKVLKMILQPSEIIPVYEVNGQDAPNPTSSEEETGVEVHETLPLPAFIGVRWVPDEDCEQCTACSSPFTVVRRRHHCRNCGRIFCHKCSSNSISIPELGYDRKVRVCNLCYLHKINPFAPCLQRGNAQAPVNPMQPSS